jgi:hypothetical protein
MSEAQLHDDLIGHGYDPGSSICPFGEHAREWAVMPAHPIRCERGQIEVVSMFFRHSVERPCRRAVRCFVGHSRKSSIPAARGTKFSAVAAFNAVAAVAACDGIASPRDLTDMSKSGNLRHTSRERKI